MVKIHPLAGQKAQKKSLVTKDDLQNKYYKFEGKMKVVKNGTSGHRGVTGEGFNEWQVAAMTQALVDIRKERGTFGPDISPEQQAALKGKPLGPIVIGKDVRFPSDFAQETAVEVFAGNGMQVIIHGGGRSTPTPVVSHTILAENAKGNNVEGVIITASHNPPDEGGYKSNGLTAGPNTRTKEIDEIANQYLQKPSMIERMDYPAAMEEGMIIKMDLITPYIEDLKNVIRFDVIRGSRFAATPLGGSAGGYYQAISRMYNLKIEEILGEPDPASANRTYDWDGKLRGDPSSRYVMKAVEGLREKLGIPFIGANDNDADRFGGEDATEGILDPNHILCVLFDHLARTRNFPLNMGIGRTIGTTHMLDLIAKDHGRPAYEVNVGFKYYVEGILNSKYVLAGEESAGGVFPRLNGNIWVTEKDGIAAVLLMMEAIAHNGKDIGTLYGELAAKYGAHQYERIDTPATAAKKERLGSLAKSRPEVESLLSGKKIAGKNIERLVVGDGIKVVLEGGIWVLKRASGTEDIIKDYREQRGDNLDIARKASEEIDGYLKLEA